MEHLNHVDDPVLETDPARELSEEFADALTINLKPEQYVSRPVAIVVEEDPAPTENIHARGYLTSRVYRVFEARILDSSLSRGMLTNSQSYSNQDLQKLGLEDSRKGRDGRANAMLTLPWNLIRDSYLAISPQARNAPISFQGNQLDESVAAILEGVTVPKYQRL